MTDWKVLTRTTLCSLYRSSGMMYLHERIQRWCGYQFLPILLFHRVTDAIPEDGLTVSTARFRAICKMLAERFQVVTLAQVFALVREQKPLPFRTVAITFDDCYLDNLAAARVLAEHGLPATFFIPSDFIGSDRSFFWDRNLPRLPNLTWNDVREMIRLGHEIGSHTASHADLGVISEEQCRYELIHSRSVIADQTGQAVRWFAHPFGGRENLRPEYIPLIREAGYQGAVSAIGGFVRPGIDTTILPREAVPYFRSIAHLEMYLSGCLELLYLIKGRPRRKHDPWNLAEAVAHKPSSQMVESAIMYGQTRIAN